MEAPEVSPKTAPASAPAVRAWRAARTSKIAGAAMRAEHDSPPTQIVERQQSGVPQREHPLIIIDEASDARPRGPFERRRLAPLERAPRSPARAPREARAAVDRRDAGATACHEMDRTSYADPASSRSSTNGSFRSASTPIERPDISERYNLGGWPTTAFLTPDGEILGGGTFVSAERMPGVLAQVADAFARARRSIAGRMPTRRPRRRRTRTRAAQRSTS